MNKIKKFILTKINEIKYRSYIRNHRYNILVAYYELLNCEELKDYWLNHYNLVEKLYEKIIKHDLSKYSKEEFDAYRKQYYPIDEIEKYNNKEAFEKAWYHHWTHNEHH